jgi:hypothetical protein
MALLWKQAMAWHDFGGDTGMSAEDAQAKPVKKAGFAGYVGHSEDFEQEMRDAGAGSRPPGEEHHEFDEDLWDHTTPEPTKEEEAHHAEHDEYPDSHWERHEKAYGDAMEAKKAESTPDHRDPDLHEFVGEHGSESKTWQNKGSLGKVNLQGPVYATQSHVGQTHINRYLDNPEDESWHRQKTPGHLKPLQNSMGYLGDSHPMFVTHQGRLHVTEGHHRVAAALQRGDKHIEGWHYDADKHGFPPPLDD